MSKFCSSCGKELNDNAVICVGCGVSLDNNGNNNVTNSKLKKEGTLFGAFIWTLISALVIEYFLGMFVFEGIEDFAIKNSYSVTVVAILLALGLIFVKTVAFFFSVRDRFRKKYLNLQNCKIYIWLARLINLGLSAYIVIYNGKATNDYLLYTAISLPSFLIVHFMIKKIVVSRNKFVYDEQK